MGGSACRACTERDKSRQCCDVNSSLFGEDAFYRDNFYDCVEGGERDNYKFSNKVKEQARLKWRKASHLGAYAKFSARKQLGSCAPSGRQLDGSPAQRNRAATLEGVSGPEFLGTMTEWTDRAFPENLDEGPYWQKGAGTGLNVRDGPNYSKNRKKVASTWTMYEAISCDSVKHGKRLENIIGKIVPESELPSLDANESCIPDMSGGKPLEWEPGCRLPRVLCINLMLPYESGLNPWAKDHGCSVVGFFQIRPETLGHLRDLDNAPPCVRLFQEFFEGPAGLPGDSEDNPSRSLAARLRKGKKKDEQGGLLKAVACCENPQDVNIPEAFVQYNGKPCLITKSGYIVKDPKHEWLEIGIDVRRFNLLARKCLMTFRSMLPRAIIHYGFWVQGTEDEDLPEGMLCDVHCLGFNMHSDPIPYEDEV